MIKTNSMRNKLCNDFSNFECNPPRSCFTCPYPDCVLSTGVSMTKLEMKFLKSGLGTINKKKGTQND